MNAAVVELSQPRSRREWITGLAVGLAIGGALALALSSYSAQPRFTASPLSIDHTQIVLPRLTEPIAGPGGSGSAASSAASSSGSSNSMGSSGSGRAALEPLAAGDAALVFDSVDGR